MINDVVVRKTGVGDVPAVMKLLRETDFIDQETPYNGRDYFQKSVDAGVFFVAEVGGAVVGMIMGEMLICGGCVVWYFAVEKSMRGGGIGRKLLRAFEHECKARGAIWVFGEGDINMKTMTFYKKMGYDFGDTYIEFFKSLAE